jgi:hypothetical protein
MNPLFGLGAIGAAIRLGVARTQKRTAPSEIVSLLIRVSPEVYLRKPGAPGALFTIVLDDHRIAEFFQGQWQDEPEWPRLQEILKRYSLRYESPDDGYVVHFFKKRSRGNR